RGDFCATTRPIGRHHHEDSTLSPSRRSLRPFLLALVASIALVATACSSGGSQSAPTETGADASKEGSSAGAGGSNGTGEDASDGECVPGMANRCSNDTVQSCDATGRWTDLMTCTS